MTGVGKQEFLIGNNNRFHHVAKSLGNQRTLRILAWFDFGV
jgi:hypothetical protein